MSPGVVVVVALVVVGMGPSLSQSRGGVGIQTLVRVGGSGIVGIREGRGRVFVRTCGWW